MAQLAWKVKMASFICSTTSLSLSMGLGLHRMAVTVQPELLMTAHFQEGMFPMAEACLQSLWPLKVQPQKLHGVTFTMFCWSKQVAGPTQIPGEGSVGRVTGAVNQSQALQSGNLGPTSPL